ncbi:MAG: ABC transporter substrate-binding protein [Deltaproteobacteria bacterium]|nr:ABC transporter substrate-binding protein [Deltaproteobacteria bacterium]
MLQRRRLVAIFVCILVFAVVALIGGILGKKTGKVQKEKTDQIAVRCAYDGTAISPMYQVDAYLVDKTTVSFCSIYCASRWHENNKDRVIYFTVIDEVTGNKFDSTLGHFVESDLVSVPEVNNRIHAFAVKEDALTHAKQFNGKLIENPFGTAFVLPQIARMDTLTIGTPLVPDSIPVKLAVFKPIFKENMLDVKIVSFEGDGEGKGLLSDGSVEGIICDLPTGLVLAKGSPSVRIVKNILRANPYRALFALVAGPETRVESVADLKGKTIAVPKGVSFRFYTEYYLRNNDIPLNKVVTREVENVAKAWDLLNKGEVSAALLRTPYSDMAAKKGMALLADDRNSPWMSVLVLKESVIKKKFKVIERFIFSLEQSVLALNLKPDEFSGLLQEQGGIPKEGRKKFPIPIFEGANCPSPDEIQTILNWLDEKGFLSKDTPYKELINPNFLPDPNDVGLAFCCR